MSRKKVKPQHIALDIEEFAIIAHYETQWLDEVGDIVEVESGSTKKVRLPKDFSRDEIGDLAQEVVEKCKYIPSTQEKV